MTAEERALATREADALGRAAYDGAGGPAVGAALVAVGGYGRGELAPCSDLDLVLVTASEAGELAQRLWYPLWDGARRVDHAVRTVPEMVAAATADPRVATGLLDLRHVAGDADLTLRLRTTMLAQWRRQARTALPALRRLVEERHERVGELAHLSVPDLKEAEGGLRDAGVLKALVATWLVDVPHAELERARVALLDVRDLLHHLAGRAVDRIGPEHWEPLAEGLGLADPEAAQLQVRELGRRVTHLSRLTWRRVDAVLAHPARGPRRAAMERLGGGVALSGGEVVLEATARPDRDPLLLLRAAAEAAERDAVLAPATAARLARETRPLPDPWPAAARQLLVRMLAAGPGLRDVWSTLEETGALERVLPEWRRVHLLPHASPIHRFTVDRHLVETCVEAAALIRRVARPDLLVVAALLHDLGKGGPGDHSLAGEPVARRVARRLGFDEVDAEVVARLVRHHLLLGTVATSRDVDDPATAAAVADVVRDRELLELLLALSEADARAASPQAWTPWRAGLVARLGDRVAQALGPGAGTEDRPVALAVPDEVLRSPAPVLRVEPDQGGVVLEVVASDRVGLLAEVAAALAVQGISVRSLRAWPQDDDDLVVGCSVWQVGDEHVDPAVLRLRMAAVRDGRLDPATRLHLPDADLDPVVHVRPEAATRATVLEVRAADHPGLLWRVLAELARLDVSVRSAHVDTVGPQAVDVFYLQEPGAGALGDARAAAAAHAVRRCLQVAR